jgi:hypothetical protein
LSQITEPLNQFLTAVFGYAPRFIAPILLAAIAWIIATVRRFAIRRALNAVNFDEMFKAAAEKKAIAYRSRMRLPRWLIG